MSRREIVFDDGGMNLLSSAALRWLRAEVEATAGCSVLIFRSGRPNVFAAGADMNEMARFTAADAAEFSRLGQETFAAIERMPCLTIAAIDGDCFGGALDLVLSFDLRFATERSRFSHPGAKLGIVTGFGGTTRWRRVIDSRAARRLFLLNDVLSASDALSLGLIDAIGDPPAIPPLDSATVQMVKELTIHGQRLSQRELVLLAERLSAYADTIRS
ncbi:MAG TPA: enoyl-CoA hydratase/isomerase family protein [Thermoanaerobaculia bacterium]|nr:enoyl-CoA hydratase/isomerase family protein [Thermoanaerobaculia bacterium]